MFSPDKRWDLYYQIVEAYVKETGHLPEKDDTYQGVPIGNWLVQQRERANLGLQGAALQLRLNSLGVLESQFTPTPAYSVYLRKNSPPSPIRRPQGVVHSRVKPAQAPPKRPAMAPKPLSKPLPVKEPHVTRVGVGSPETSAAVIISPEPVSTTAIIVGSDSHPTSGITQEIAPSVNFELNDTSPPTGEEEPISPNPEISVGMTTPTQKEEPKITKPTAAPRGRVRDTSGTPTNQEAFTERLETIAQFYTTHKRLPLRSEAHLRAGGVSMNRWLRQLPPLVASGSLPEEWRKPLSEAAWWPTIEERARVLREKASAGGTDNKKKPPVAKPPVAKSAVAKPPVVKAAVAKAAVAKPQVVEPPVVKAPVVKAPVVKAPVVKPPVVKPPVVKPPVVKPPVVKPPVVEPVAVKPTEFLPPFELETALDPTQALYGVVVWRYVEQHQLPTVLETLRHKAFSVSATAVNSDLIRPVGERRIPAEFVNPFRVEAEVLVSDLELSLSDIAKLGFVVSRIKVRNYR